MKGIIIATPISLVLWALIIYAPEVAITSYLLVFVAAFVLCDKRG